MEYYILVYVLVIVLSLFLINKLKNVKSLYQHTDIDVEETVLESYSKPEENQMSGKQLIVFILLMFLYPIVFSVLYSRIMQSSSLYSAHEISFFPSVGWASLIFFFIGIPLSGISLYSFYLLKNIFKPTSTIKKSHLVAPFELRLMLILFLVMFMICFPLIALTSDYYTYYEEESIYVNRFLSLKETEYRIPDDIEYAEFKYSIKEGKYSFFYYVYFKDGKNAKLLHNNIQQIDDVVYIHNEIVSNGLQVKVEHITSEGWDKVVNQYSEEITKSILRLYGFDD